MTALEALRLQVDTLTREKEQMEAENLRLRDGTLLVLRSRRCKLKEQRRDFASDTTARGSILPGTAIIGSRAGKGPADSACRDAQKPAELYRVKA